MIDFLKNIKQKDPAAKSYLEIILCYPGVHAVALHKIAHIIYKFKLPLLPRMISYFNRFFTGVDIHPAAQIGENLFIDHAHGIVIGETAIIGNNVTIFHGVTLGSRHLHSGKRHPTIGNDVLIGSGAKILGNIKIGDHAKIGAGSIVIKNVPEYAIVVASTAKEIQENCIEYYI